MTGSLLARFIGHFAGSLAYMIEAAAIVSGLTGHWDDFSVITDAYWFRWTIFAS